MTKYYAIGIGGSGAKSIEALIHLCAAGLGPDTLTVALVDPDASNGNLRRTSDTLEYYNKARGAVYRDRSSLGRTCRLLKTEISKNTHGLSWSPALTARSMHDLFDYNLMANGERTLFDALYLTHEEQNMPLGQGFRGRPNVGAAVLSGSAHETDVFWSEIFSATAQATLGQEVRIFLIGSLFGGTGASGFPVTARMLRNHIRNDNVESDVRLSGCLLLPYFSFPSNSSDTPEVTANSSLFLAKARYALNYYHHLLATEVVFDDLYLVGWPYMIVLPEHHTGGQEQCNPPLLPEIYSALAAAHFFAIPSIEPASRTGGGSKHVFHIGKGTEQPNLIGWSDLPNVSEGKHGRVKEALAQLIRFAYAYARVYAPLLNRTTYKKYCGHPWFRHHLVDVADLGGETEQEAVKAIKNYCEMLLRYWLTVTRDESAGGELKVQLLENTGLALGNHNPADALLNLRPEVDTREYRRFDSMIKDAEAGSLDVLLDWLSDRSRRLDQDSMGLGRFVAALYEGSALKLIPNA